jgi:transcriptional regulator with XRE-family HTH domain
MQTTVDAVRRLIGQRQSQRRIAEELGVSRTTVYRIARGRRPDPPPRVSRKERDEEPVGRIARCAGCGGRVYLPCRLCKVRRLKRGKP